MYRLFEAATNHKVSDDSYGDDVFVTLKDTKKGKVYRDSPCSLWKLIGSDWSTTLSDVLHVPGSPTPTPDECKKKFCDVFGVESNRLEYKQDMTLAVVLQEGAALPKRLEVDAQPPQWVIDAVKAAKKLSPNPAASTVQSPALPANGSPPPKKQRKEPTQIDLCIKSIKEELTKEEVGKVKELLDDLVNIVDGNTLQPSHLFSKDRIAKTKAGVLFAVLLARMGGGTLLSALSHLWVGNQKCAALASTGVASSESTASAAATVDGSSEIIAALTNLPVINVDNPIPDEVAQSITDNVLRSVKKNQGKAITLPPSLSMAFGAMAYAQTAGCWTDSKVSRIVAARTGLQNNREHDSSAD